MKNLIAAACLILIGTNSFATITNVSCSNGSEPELVVTVMFSTVDQNTMELYDYGFYLNNSETLEMLNFGSGNAKTSGFTSDGQFYLTAWKNLDVKQGEITFILSKDQKTAVSVLKDPTQVLPIVDTYSCN